LSAYLQASKRPQTVAMSSVTREGTSDLMTAMETALSSQMEFISCIISYNDVTLLSTVHNLGILDEVVYQDEGVFVRGKVPLFLKEQIENRNLYDDEGDMKDDEDDEKKGMNDEEWSDVEKVMSEDDDFDWTGMAKGRHAARRMWDQTEKTSSIYRSTSKDSVVMASLDGLVGHTNFFDNYGGINTEIPLLDDIDEDIEEGVMNVAIIPRVRRVKKSKCTTDINKKKTLQTDGDDFNDTSRLLDFDAGDYYGSASRRREKRKDEIKGEGKTSNGDVQ
jgi:putative intracellular protease/amidase